MPQTIDASGIPPEAVQAIESLVALIRAQQPTTEPIRASELTKEERLARLHAWVNSHPKRETEFDDSRESIYAGRGE